jgi:acetyl esterase/lipase
MKAGMKRWALLVWIASLAVAEPTAAGVRVTEGIVYGTGRVTRPAAGQARLLLDLYRPAARSRTRRPVVVLVHGGGFRGGSRTQPQLVRLAGGLARRGIVVASIDYRLQPQGPVPSRRVRTLTAAAPDLPVFTAMVAAVDDTLTALDWLQAHARRIGVDARRIGLVGGSAGAITADHVAYALDDFGVAAPRIRFVGDLWGGVFLKAPSAATGAAQLERGEARLFCVHGTADRTVPVTLDDALVARARAVGVPVEYDRIDGAGHGFANTGFFVRDVTAGMTPYERLLRFATRALR